MNKIPMTVTIDAEVRDFLSKKVNSGGKTNLSSVVNTILSEYKSLHNSTALDSLKRAVKEKEELILKAQKDMKEIQDIIDQITHKEGQSTYGKNPTDKMVIETALMKNPYAKAKIIELLPITEESEIMDKCITLSERLKQDNPKWSNWMIADVIKSYVLPRMREKNA
jgi:Arc/MetJ-type ribon-helix-helix transcriptional regulator